MLVHHGASGGAYAKRGCSEYGLRYPDYNDISYVGPQLMNYEENWRDIENTFDSTNTVNSLEYINPSIMGLSLSDALIIRNWIDYAKGIGDTSVKLLGEESKYYRSIFFTAKARIELYPWSEPS